MEAGRMLLRRGMCPVVEDAVTFDFGKRAVRGLRSIESSIATDRPVRRLESHGAEVFSAMEIFVRRIPPTLDRWLRDRPRQFDQPAIFFAVFPLALILSLSGPQAAALYLGVLEFCALAPAIRGRIGAETAFPLRACFCRAAVATRAISQRLLGAAAPDDRQQGARSASDARRPRAR